MKQDELQKKFVDEGVKFFKSNDRGYYNLAMRFGKCKTTIELLFKLFEDDVNIPTVLIAYPDNKLRDVWINECEKWSYDNPNIVFVNFSSLKKHVEYGYDVFIIDEFHSASSRENDYAHEIMDNCKYTIGLSGTVSDDTKCEWNFEEIASYTTEEGIRDGILADYQITVHMVNLDNNIKTKDKKGKYTTEKTKYVAYTWVIENLKRRGSSVMHLALARNRLSLSSIGKMNYLKKMLAKMQDKRVLIFTGLADVADKVGCASYHSKSKSDDGYTGFQEKRYNHLALAAMGKVGVTYTDLDSVILLNFTYNAEESSQILNRAIKLDYHGKIADLHIICLNEDPEIKKIKKSLEMLDQSKIKYIKSYQNPLKSEKKVVNLQKKYNNYGK